MRPPDGWEIDKGDPRYPETLLTTPDPPKRIYGLGNPNLLTPGLAVIGARKSTPYGRSCAHLFAGWAASRGVVIVSGAAVGCDQAAHRAALEVDGATVAVLGCGADVDYPRDATQLLDVIRARGAVISEQPWGSTPRRWAFSRRNRIIAGLSHSVLVVEASLPSGTFSTADHALEADREVLVVPGSILSPECRGSNRLLVQGATPITDVSELAAVLGLLGAPEDAEHTVSHDLSRRDAIMTALVANPMRPDDLAREFALDIVTVARRLGELERDGKVIRLRDGRYSPVENKRRRPH